MQTKTEGFILQILHEISNKTFTNSFKVKLGTQFIFHDENRFLDFCKICTEALYKYVPLKRQTIGENQSPFINKEISEAIIKRTELRNKFLKHKTDRSRQAFAKQRNFFVTSIVMRKTLLWKTIKPLFSIKQNLQFLSS